MAATNPDDIVKTALAKGELVKLLLGAPEYQYRSRFSPAPGDTDLTDLLPVIFDDPNPQSREIAKDALVKALDDLSGTYEGIDAISTCILIETFRKSDGRPRLGLSLYVLANKLHATIRKFESRLRADKTGGGRGHPDGLLGDLRRLSRISAYYGGPAFWK